MINGMNKPLKRALRSAVIVGVIVAAILGVSALAAIGAMNQGQSGLAGGLLAFPLIYPVQILLSIVLQQDMITAPLSTFQLTIITALVWAFFAFCITLLNNLPDQKLAHDVKRNVLWGFTLGIIVFLGIELPFRIEISTWVIMGPTLIGLLIPFVHKAMVNKYQQTNPVPEQKD
jgi:hypothetical protein